MSTGPGIRANSPEIKATYIIMARHVKCIIKALKILSRAMRIKAQPTARRAIMTHHPTTNPLRTGVHPRVNSHKVPM